MISVTEAKQIIRANIRALPSSLVNLADAGNSVLAENIYAAVDIPAFDQSNVDGYAIRFSEKDITLDIDGEITAGSEIIKSLSKKKAIRIFTGAPAPEGADTIVMQENTAAANNTLTINDPALSKGMNLRPRGTDIRKDELALEEGTLLTPAAIGYLAAVGSAKVNIYRPPALTLIITGNELAQPGLPLRTGQVYDSGSFALKSALQLHGIRSPEILHCQDDPHELTLALRHALSESDMVILTGGVSVGEYDFVSQAAENCGVTKLFHRVKQRPGKPLYFGMKDDKPIFGLPGNPSSILTCMYVYVSLALNMYLHKKESLYQPAILKNAYRKTAGLTHFMKGMYNAGYVEILTGQESYRMSSFAKSNCLVILPETETEFKPGYQTQVHLL
ncbi:MAG: molybdopterin molybdotransferase MoeA [Chitinophagaceae bacterium]|nr:molybdopterin molybdotransferase MoeA [Chitinophagaceae bacterium]